VKSPEGAAADLDLEGLRRTVAEVLGVGPERIGDTDNLVDLGVDSVKVMAISARLRGHRVRVGYAGLVEEPSLAAWWRMISAAAAGADTAGRTR
jgi:aryl carrier-like protein